MPHLTVSYSELIQIQIHQRKHCRCQIKTGPKSMLNTRRIKIWIYEIMAPTISLFSPCIHSEIRWIQGIPSFIRRIRMDWIRNSLFAPSKNIMQTQECLRWTLPSPSHAAIIALNENQPIWEATQMTRAIKVQTDIQTNTIVSAAACHTAQGWNQISAKTKKETPKKDINKYTAGSNKTIKCRSEERWW